MTEKTGQNPYRHALRVLVALVIIQLFYWFFAADDILNANREARFLATKDPGAFLVPAPCLFFRGTEGEDFVRGSGNIRGSAGDREVCWYTQSTFTKYFPELQGPSKEQTIAMQVNRTGMDVNRPDPDWTLIVTAIWSLVIAYPIGVVAAVLYWLARARNPELARKAHMPRPEAWKWERKS
jgi:hypothetical protein